MKMHVKIGDNVKIISGFYKEKEGEVTKLLKNSGKIIVKGINLKTKHIKPSKKNEDGKIKQIEAQIHHSNVQIVKN